MHYSTIGRVAPWILAGVAGWFCYQLLARHNRLLARLAAIEACLQALERQARTVSEGEVGQDAYSAIPLPPTGLPAGSPAPPFDLRALDGQRLGLDHYRGRRLLLVITDIVSDSCVELLPHLQALHQNDGLQVLIVSQGNAETNRVTADAYGLTAPVAVQQHLQVSRAYGLVATPAAYAIDERGIIEFEITVGAAAILALALSMARDDDAG